MTLAGKMVRGDFCLEVSAGKLSLWCFVMETFLQISSESYVFVLVLPRTDHKTGKVEQPFTFSSKTSTWE